jgi:hypothetical protein
MRKQPGVVSHCRPSFDSLEERVLMSGGHPGSTGPGEMFWSSPPHAGHSEPIFLGRPPFDGAPWSEGEWAQSPDGAPPSRPGEPAPSQPAGSSPSPQAVLGPLNPSGSFSQSKSDSASGLESPSGIAAGPGALATSVATGQPATTEPEPSGAISLESPAAGNAAIWAGVGKETGQEPGGVGNGPSSPAVASPPAQLLSLSEADSTWARLVSQGAASAGGDQQTGNGAGRGAFTPSGRPGAAITTRGLLLSTAYVSTDLTDGSHDDERPRASSADLIARALPFDRAAIDRAIDQFFQQFDVLGGGDLAGRGPAHTLMYMIALASTFAALDVVRRRWRLTTSGRHVRVRHPRAAGGPIGFPELPGSWCSRPS